jgi:hypothetical protein
MRTGSAGKIGGHCCGRLGGSPAGGISIGSKFAMRFSLWTNANVHRAHSVNSN